MSVMMVQTKRKLNHRVIPQTVPYSEQRNWGKTSTTKEQQKLKIGKVRFRLNIDVRKEDSRLNVIKQLITLVKAGLNFSCKSTTAAIVDLKESLFGNWLKNNHVTVDRIYYLRSLFVFFYKCISQPQKTARKTESRILWHLAKIRLE